MGGKNGYLPGRPCLIEVRFITSRPAPRRRPSGGDYIFLPPLPEATPGAAAQNALASICSIPNTHL
jgi:hypothetical protein